MGVFDGPWRSDYDPSRDPYLGKAISLKERLDYQANVALGDMEFSQAIAPYLDPEDRKHINPSQAKFAKIKRPLSLHGRNTIGMKEPLTQGIHPALHPEGRDSFTFEPGNIYAMNAVDAEPGLWSHEFRHESDNLSVKWGDRKLGKHEESLNRYEDIYHAINDFDEKRSLEMLADILQRQSDDNSDAEDDYGKRIYFGRNYWMDQARELRPSLIKQMKSLHESRAKLDKVIELVDKY